MVLEYLNFRRVIAIQEILYNSKLDQDAINKLRGQLYEIDQMMMLPQTAKAHHEMAETQGLKVVDPKAN